MELNIDYAIGFYNRGICYYEIDEFELAIKDLEKAKSQNAEFDGIDFYLGASYCFLENFEKAIDLFSMHLLKYKDLNALKWRSDLYYFTDQFELANNDITELLLHESESIDYYEDIQSLIHI